MQGPPSTLIRSESSLGSRIPDTIYHIPDPEIPEPKVGYSYFHIRGEGETPATS